jgi:predicted DCC family thiol-disulfide oxidoreductase YuxK
MLVKCLCAIDDIKIYFPMSAAKTEFSESVAPSPESAAPAWQIELLYDGECPLCVREVNFLKKRDAGRGLVSFVDIADDGYNPKAHGGIDYETAMGRIHAILPDGTTVKNVEVFRRTYEILGMGWVYAVTKLPAIGAIANWLYGIWAHWRLKLTGRPDLATIMSDRTVRIECESQGRCQPNSK